MVKCFLDLEFNLSDANASSGRYGMECVSIGAYFIDDNNEFLEQFYSLIKPKKNAKLGHYYAKLTHLNQDDIYNANNFNEVMEEFSNIYFKYENVIIYTWGTEDKRMLFRDMKHNLYNGKLKKEFKQIIDLQEIVSNSIKHNNKVIKKQWALKDVQILYNNIDYENHHNALVDAIMLKDIYLSFYNKKSLNVNYLQTFIEKSEQEETQRLQDFEDSKNNYFKLNRIETYINLKGWSAINREFLKKYPMIKHKYYNCKKIIVTINNNKIDIFYILNKDDLGHLHLILDINNFRRIRKYLNNLNKNGTKDVL